MNWTLPKRLVLNQNDLDRPNCFGWVSTNCLGLVQIVLVESKSFWSGSIFWTNIYHLDRAKMIWTRPK